MIRSPAVDLELNSKKSENLVLRGCLIKKFPNVLLNKAKLVNPTVKSQAKGQNYFSTALKRGIVCLFKSSSIENMIKNRKC